jgi:mono/diheme cytochrome c family protein
MPPRALLYIAILLVALSLLPLALFVRARSATSEKPRLHLIFDMDNQVRRKAQSFSPLFEDGRAMRPPVEGTVARGELGPESVLWSGRNGADEFIDGYPEQIRMTEEFVLRGQERFNIYCAPCHGVSGYGDGMINRRALDLAEGTWTPATSMHDKIVRERPNGHLYNTIKNGIRNMPGYGAQIPVQERWAIVAYVRALQRSQRTSIEDVPPAKRNELR